MNDLFDHARHLLGFATVGVTAAFVKVLVVKDRRTFLGVITAVLAGVFVATLTGISLSDYAGIGEGTKYALVAAAAIISENLIWAIVKLGTQVERHGPKAVVKHIKRKFDDQ